MDQDKYPKAVKDALANLSVYHLIIKIETKGREIPRKKIRFFVVYESKTGQNLQDLTKYYVRLVSATENCFLLVRLVTIY
jgi:hypothetical protein